MVKCIHSGDPDVIQAHGLQVTDYSGCFLAHTIQLTWWSYIDFVQTPERMYGQVDV
jgi:hypothetical protein